MFRDPERVEAFANVRDNVAALEDGNRKRIGARSTKRGQLCAPRFNEFDFAGAGMFGNAGIRGSLVA